MHSTNAIVIPWADRPGAPWAGPEIVIPELGRALERDFDLPGLAALAGQLALDPGQPDQAVDLLSLAAAQAGPAQRSRACATVAATLLELGRPGAATAWARRSGEAALLAACLARTPDYPYDDALNDGLRRLDVTGLPHCRALTGGHVNRLYRVDCDGRSVVLRLGRFPPAPSDRFWRERHNLTVAAGRGLAPAPLAMDVGDGTLILPVLAPDPVDMRGTRRPEAVARLFARLHGGPPLLGRADPFSLADRRLTRLDGLRTTLAPDLDRLHDQAARIRAALLATAGPPRPCHADPHPANFVLHDDRLMLIDWQAAAMADPDWDIALFLSRANLEAPGRARFLDALGRQDPIRAQARIELWEMMVHYLDLIAALECGLSDPGDGGWPALARQALRQLRPWCASERPAWALGVLHRT